MGFDNALAFAFTSVLSIPYGLDRTLPQIVAAVG